MQFMAKKMVPNNLGALTATQVGTNDNLISTGGYLVGDAAAIYDHARGGNDKLTGGNVENIIVGDAFEMFNYARGGDDLLIAGDNVDNYLYGDSFTMYSYARGGNDVLISGTGTDYMWGDAKTINGLDVTPLTSTGKVTTGSDTFVFGPNNGNDLIFDFRHSDGDKIDLKAYHFHDFNEVKAAMSDLGNDTHIDFGGGNSLTLVGVPDFHNLQSSDFLL